MEPTKLEDIFMKWTLLDWWDTLVTAYTDLGFTDELSDEARIVEFTKIVKLINTWIDKVQGVVAQNWLLDKEKAIEDFKQMTDRTQLNSRTNITYANIRNNWNDLMIKKLTKIMEDEIQHWTEEQEGSDDKWIMTI